MVPGGVASCDRGVFVEDDGGPSDWKCGYPNGWCGEAVRSGAQRAWEVKTRSAVSVGE